MNTYLKLAESSVRPHDPWVGSLNLVARLCAEVEGDSHQKEETEMLWETATFSLDESVSNRQSLGPFLPSQSKNPSFTLGSTK